MADKTADADHFARDPRITGAAASSMNALKPLMLFQVSMLGMWAHSIERFADNYEKALDETRRGTPSPCRRDARSHRCDARSCDRQPVAEHPRVHARSDARRRRELRRLRWAAEPAPLREDQRSAAAPRRRRGEGGRARAPARSHLFQHLGLDER